MATQVLLALIASTSLLQPGTPEFRVDDSVERAMMRAARDGPDMTKIGSAHYRIGTWNFDSVYGPDRPSAANYGTRTLGTPSLGVGRRVSMIVAWRTTTSGDESGELGAGLSAVVYVRSSLDWPAVLGPLPAGAEQAKGWLRAYWKEGEECYNTMLALAGQEGAESFRCSDFWRTVSQRKLTDDAATPSVAAQSEDPIAQAALRPAKVPRFSEREPWLQGNPAWHPSGLPCEGAVRPTLTEAVLFQKLTYVFEVFRSGSPSCPDPDPCMLVCPGTVILRDRMTALEFARTDAGAGTDLVCVYEQSPSMVWASSFAPSYTVSSTSKLEWKLRGLSECVPASSLPRTPFELIKLQRAGPSACTPPEVQGANQRLRAPNEQP